MKKSFIMFSILALFVIILSIIIGSFDVFLYLDLVSFVIVIIIPLFLLIAQYKINEILNIYKNLFNKELNNPKEIRNIIHFLKSLNKYIIVSGLIGTLYGIIGIFAIGFNNLYDFLKGI